ncbi:MAG: hypothetical protein ACXV2E_04010 [Halobacteriota archaeon]
MPSGIVINGVGDALAAALGILESAQEEVIWLVPQSVNSLSRHYDFVKKARAFVQGGGVSRGIVQITRANIEEVLLSVENGENVRHSDEVHELFMYVGDGRQSISGINVGVEEYALDTPIVAFWSESPAYAEYLLASFENAWSQAVPAKERIEELLRQG